MILTVNLVGALIKWSQGVLTHTILGKIWMYITRNYLQE